MPGKKWQWWTIRGASIKSLFTSHLAGLAKKGIVNVLDVGRGIGIFWKALSNKIKQQVPDSISHR